MLSRYGFETRKITSKLDGSVIHVHPHHSLPLLLPLGFPVVFVLIWFPVTTAIELREIILNFRDDSSAFFPAISFKQVTKTKR